MNTFVYLYYLFISRFGFKSDICLLIASVPVHCFSITLIASIPDLCILFTFLLTYAKGRFSYDAAHIGI